MRRTATFYFGFMLLLSFHATSARAKDLTVNLKFVPQEGVHSESPDLPPTMLESSYELRVEDGRSAAEALTIGKGTDDDDHTFAINAGSDVVGYVKETLRQLSESWGLKTSEPKERVLTLKVTLTWSPSSSTLSTLPRSSMTKL